GAGAALPRRALPRLPVALRGLRDSRLGGDGVRDAGGDERRRSDRGGRGRGRRARRPVRPGLDSGRDRGGRRAARRAAARGARAGAALQLGRRSTRNVGGLRRGRRVSEPLVVVDADALGRCRTGDETYVAGLLGALAGAHEGLRLAAVTRRPDLVPAGIEPLELPARTQEL